eukprot:352976-Hanusia_phi.AAC.1
MAFCRSRRSACSCLDRSARAACALSAEAFFACASLISASFCVRRCSGSSGLGDSPQEGRGLLRLLTGSSTGTSVSSLLNQLTISLMA